MVTVVVLEFSGNALSAALGRRYVSREKDEWKSMKSTRWIN